MSLMHVVFVVYVVIVVVVISMANNFFNSLFTLLHVASIVISVNPYNV